MAQSRRCARVAGFVAVLFMASACASLRPQSQVTAQPTPTIIGAAKPAATLTAISALQVTATPTSTPLQSVNEDSLVVVAWSLAAVLVVLVAVIVWRRGGPHDPDQTDGH